jgi:hypothetical protein
MIEICRNSIDEAQHGPIPNEYEHGQAWGKDGPGSAILGWDNQREAGHPRRRAATEDD